MFPYRAFTKDTQLKICLFFILSYNYPFLSQIFKNIYVNLIAFSCSVEGFYQIIKKKSVIKTRSNFYVYKNIIFIDIYLIQNGIPNQLSIKIQCTSLNTFLHFFSRAYFSRFYLYLVNIST